MIEIDKEPIPLIASGAHIGPYVSVRAQVQRERVGDAKGLAAHLAAVGLLAGMDTLVLHLFVRPGEDTLTVLTGKSWFILLSIGRLFIGIGIAIAIAIAVQRTFVNLQMHLIVGSIFKFAIANAAQELLLALVHLLVHRQQVLLEAAK